MSEILVQHISSTKKKKGFWSILVRQRYLYLMSIPFVIWVFVFNYLPIWGWLMAFQKFRPGRSILHQQWVGLDNFRMLFHDDQFYNVLKNTLAMSFMGLIAGFTVPIFFAVILNEVRRSFIKRFVQTVSYLPHFVSWVVVAGIVTKLLALDGVVNQLLVQWHILHEPVQFMAKQNLFWYVVTSSDIWKETGWNAIIYLAAIAGISADLYEAAHVDGAGRIRQIWHITLPGIRSTIILLLILSIGNLLSIGFEKQFLLGNNLVKEKSEVLDLYALNYGLGMGRYSFGTAINIFNSVISLFLLFVSNGILKKITKESIM